LLATAQALWSKVYAQVSLLKAAQSLAMRLTVILAQPLKLAGWLAMLLVLMSAMFLYKMLLLILQT